MSNDQSTSPAEESIKTELPETTVEEVPAADLDDVTGGMRSADPCTVTVNCDKTSL